MDAVCLKGGWDVVLEQDEKGSLLGLLVYHHRKYRGFSMILMPPMTAYNGIYIIDQAAEQSKEQDYTRVSEHNRISEALINRLTKTSLYYQQYHTSYTNWLPLYWKGYKETTRYTYLLDAAQGKESAMKGLRDNLRRSIKNAEKRCIIKEIPFTVFWEEAEKSFKNRSKALPINKTVLENLCNAFVSSGQIKIRAAIHNESGRILSGAVLALDDTATYYISSFYHPELKPTGTMAYVLWESIFMRQNKIFDFEGSILKEVEFYFRSFGGTLTPHYRIFKITNPLLNLGLTLFKPNFFG